MHGFAERGQSGEAELREALAYAESIVDTVRQPLLVLDRDTSVRSANDAFCHIFGISEAETRGSLLFRLRNGEFDVPQLRLLLEQVLANDSAEQDLELEQHFKELGQKTLLINARRLVLQGGESGLTVLAIEDITERKRIERALAESEKKRQIAMDAAPAIIAYIDRSLRFRMVNSTYERWFGVAPSRLIGAHISDLFGDAQIQALQPQIQRVLAGETVMFEADYPALTGSKTLQVTYTPDFDASGKMQGFIVLGNDITARKAAEIAVQKGQERWRNLFESMAEGFFVGEILYDELGNAIDCRLLEVNPAFEEQSGIRNAAGKTIRELIPGVQEELIQTYARVVRTGQPEDFEIVVPALNTSWFEVRARAMEGDRFTVMFLNVTERKKNERHLQENERRQAALVALGDRLRDLKDLPSLSLVAMEIAGTALNLTRAGYGTVIEAEGTVRIESDWTNGTASSLVGTYRFSDFGEDLLANLRTGAPLVVDDVMTHPQTARDSSRWKALDIRAVVNIPLVENGQLQAILFLQDSVPRTWTESELTFLRKVADRTWAAAERARAFQELQDSEEFTRSILASSPDCVKILDLNGRLLSVNESGCRQMEIEDPSVCLYQPWLEFWSHNRDDAANALAAAKRGKTEKFEALYLTSKGTPKWWEVIVSPIRDSLGKPIRILSLSRDITERKIAEEERDRLTRELRRSNEDLSQFAHTVAHDLQSPLRGVTSFAQLLERRAAERLLPKDLEYLNHIVASAHRMGELVAALLRFAQVGQGIVPSEPVDMGLALDEAMASLKLQIIEQGAQILRGQMPTVIGDAIQLAQVMQNLVSNALKYRRPDVTPTVTIGATRQSEFYVFSVQDNGEGIAPEHLSVIFEPLKRLHSGDIPGTGLGLAMCQRIVKRHGGRIWVESELGVGSTFFFSLPIVGH